MNDHIGKDSTGSWTPAQYAIDAGWDYTCIEATAAKGVAESDAEGLTEAQQVALLAFCKSRVAEKQEATVREMLTDMGDELDRTTLEECARLLGWEDPERAEYDDGEFFSHLCQAVNLQ